jgi:hypothetical protein
MTQQAVRGLVTALLLLGSGAPAQAQLDDLCREGAQRYERLLYLKGTASAKDVAETYVEVFATKAADREAQEVWRRMRADGLAMDGAIEAHLDRYHASRSAEERADLQAAIADQIKTMTIIRQAVYAFESAVITPELAAGAMETSWGAQNWDAPYPLDHYISLIRSTAADYAASGMDGQQASVRAALDARSAWDRDRGVSGSMIPTPGDPCYGDEEGRMEYWLRQAALTAAIGPLTAEEAAYISESTSFDPRRISRLSFYTDFQFGPRDYSFDRFETWEMAASSR